jgi:hypothetical protein
MRQIVASQVVGKRREPGAERLVIDQITRESDGTYLALVGKVGQSCDRRKYCSTIVEALEFAAGLRLGDGVLEERDEWELAEDWEATFKDSVRACIGIESVKSHAARTAFESPAPSLPRTSIVGARNGSSTIECFESPARP